MRDFDDFDDSSRGSGSVSDTERKSDWQCYALSSGDNSDCNPDSTKETRNRETYDFDRFGSSDQVCADSRDREYNYGVFELSDGDMANDCARSCVDEPIEDTLEFLVGFDWNCIDHLCHWQVKVFLTIARGMMLRC